MTNVLDKVQQSLYPEHPVRDTSSTAADSNASGPLGIENLFSVNGFKAVVTGGGTGIGLMITQALVRNGAKVYITGRRAEPLDLAVKNYSEQSGGGKIVPIVSDISDKSQVEALAREIASQEPDGINLLVNNAGIAPEEAMLGKQPDDKMGDVDTVYRWLWNAEPEEWRRTFDTNVMGQYYVAVAFLPLLHKATNKTPGHSSSIINITSVSGVTKSPSKGQYAYTTSKAAALHLTRVLADTFKELGVRVNSIAPGIFPSEQTQREPYDQKNKNYLEQGEKPWPAKRAGDEADIGGTVLWLASTAGLFVNGQNIALDGGLTLISPAASMS